MAGLAYEKRQARPEESPKGQIPFIDASGVRIGDSTFIRGFLERTYGIDFDEGLTPEQRATAWAVERMMENHFGWTLARSAGWTR
jgi:glutathione S-transferase